ncbi:MAG: TlpA disulfide reductase family protein [Chloroflexota bacterium]
MTDSTSQTHEITGRPSPILIVFLLFPILGILAAVALAVSSGVAANNPVPTPESITLQDATLVDKPAPNFELAALDGTRQRLSSYRGRTVFVNFWATWCEPCKRELPAFEQFQAQQGTDGAVILAVNVAETSDTINQYFTEQNITGLNVLLDANQDVYQAFGINVFPTTYVIDSAGVVRYKYLGEMKLTDMDDALKKTA